jgi:NTP pyrophosphatase (non-canonical NTP hydrolase)
LIDFSNHDVLSENTIYAVIREANRAHDKHKAAGGSLLDPSLTVERKLAALMEECGEVAHELSYDVSLNLADLKKELIQVANVALTWYEYISRTNNVGA